MRSTDIYSNAEKGPPFSAVGWRAGVADMGGSGKAPWSCRENMRKVSEAMLSTLGYL